MIVNYNLSRRKVPRIVGVQFGVLSQQEIEKMSVVEVSDVNIYHRGLPQEGGINDTRMGTVDRRILCSTCGCDVEMCSGHVGHIKLAMPCYHIGFFETILKVLRSVCFVCSRITVSETDMRAAIATEETCKNRFATVYNAARAKKKCCHCGFVKPVYVRQSLGIKIEWPANMEWESPEETEYCTRTFTAQEAFSITDNITDEDAEVLGFNAKHSHPRHMIMRSLVVPPPISRPAIMASEGSRSRGQDDLTHKLQDINKRNNDLRAAILAAGRDRDCEKQKNSLRCDVADKYTKLQYEVFSFVNNNIRGQKQSTQRSGAPFKSLSDRLKGKDGRIRGNLMGKRVNFSGRSVISPDPIMDTGSIGVPYSIAKNLTIQESVQPHNIAELTQRVHNGPDDIFGAATVIHGDNEAIHLRCCDDRSSIRLKYGMTVERYLKDGDYVIFNRQPSLHRMGMLGHKVQLMPGLTFRLNLACNSPYNADFDGDEMNIHVVQSPLARAEVRYLMAVQTQIISPQASKPVMGIVQDSLVGAYLMTYRVTLHLFSTSLEVASWIKYTHRDRLPPPAVLHPRRMWTGHQLFSLLFPREFALERGDWSGAAPPATDALLIRHGELLFGALNKSILGTSAGGVIDVLFRDHGPATAINFMTNEQRLVINWLLIRGFSIGMRDCVLDDKASAAVTAKLRTAIRNIDLITNEVTDVVMLGEAENTKVKILSKILMQTAVIVTDNMRGDNAIKLMVAAGSKGNPVNQSQICGCVGQQSVEGQRIRAEKGNRTLPCFPFGCESVNAHGLVQNSYALGVRADEFFFHAMGGREGLVDTAVKTATTGYIQRRQMKAMEDIKVHYDGTVRMGSNSVMEFRYGGDGMEPTKLERQKMTCLKWDATRLRSEMVGDEPDAVTTRQHDRLANILEQIRSVRANQFEAIDDTTLLPFNMRRVMKGIVKNVCPADQGSHLQYASALQDALTECRRITRGHPLLCLEAFLLWNMSSLRLSRCGASIASVQRVLTAVVDKTRFGQVNPGEAVGSIAAQSVGEPCTQMSASWDTEVLVRVGGHTVSTPIGKLVDGYFGAQPHRQELPVDGIYCLGVDERERVAWARVTHVSRHPVSGNMISVSTRGGRQLKMTLSHSFLVRRDNRIVPLRGSALCLGDHVPVVKKFPSSTLDPERPGSASTTQAVRQTGAAGLAEPLQLKLTLGVGRFAGAVVALGLVSGNEASFASTDGAWVQSILTAMRGSVNDFSLTCSQHVPTGGSAGITLTRGMARGYNLTAWMARHFAWSGSETWTKEAAAVQMAGGNMKGRVPDWLVTAPAEFVRGFLQSVFDAAGAFDEHADGTCELTLATRTSTHAKDAARAVRARQQASLLCLCLARFQVEAHVRTNGDVAIPSRALARFDAQVGLTRPEKASRIRSLLPVQADASESHLQGMEHIAERVRIALDTPRADRTLPPGIGAGAVAEAVTLSLLVEWRARLLALRAVGNIDIISEIDQAIDAHVWWDPIVAIVEQDGGDGTLVYDFTVEESLQSFMLTNGVFVHNTLNTFHYAGCGSKNVTLGIPRLKELLDNSRSIRTPCKTFRLLPPFDTCLAFAEMIAKRLVQCTLRDFVRTTDVRYAPARDAGEEGAAEDADVDLVALDALVDGQNDKDASRWIGRVTLNKRKMRQIGITPPYLKRIVHEMLGGHVHVVASEINCVEWVVRFRFLNVAQMVRKVPAAHRDAMEEKIVIRLLSHVIDKTCVSGVNNVTAASARMVDVWCPRTMRTVTVTAIDVMGGSLLDLVNVPCLDWYTSHTNDVNEAVGVLGIEAAFTVILTELMTTLLFDGGSYINPRHCTMIVNTMTSRGFVMPLSRHGMNRMDNSPLVRCSFEETIDVLFDAAMHAQKDNAEGITQNIMTGQTSFVGTGMFDVSDATTPVSTVLKRKLLKSRVSQMGRVNVDVSLEYINPNVWSWQGPREANTMQTPFSTVNKDASNAALTASFSQPFQTRSSDSNDPAHKVAKNEAQKKRFYSPSSPLLVSTKAARG